MPINKQDLINKIQAIKELSNEDKRTEISGLQKGELIIKNQDAYLLGIGQKYKKIKVTHII
jgi:hypothetical protein